VQNSLCVASKSCPVLYWHSSSGREPNFAAWYKERNKELSPRALPIFGKAAIALGMASAYIIVARVNNVLCTFCKQKMIVLADSEVSDVKVT